MKHETGSRSGGSFKMCVCVRALKVGTMEMFRGQERRVILVSTVCSSQYQTWPNNEFTSGFVKNEKVYITNTLTQHGVHTNRLFY